MALFPMPFLKSFAYAGVAVVAFAAIAAMVVTPAAIVLLGERLDAWMCAASRVGCSGRPAPAARPVEQTIWYRWTKAVMRRSIPIGLAVVALLLVLGAPFLGIKWGYPDDRVLPGSAQARQVGDELRAGFAINSLTDVTVRDSAHGRGDAGPNSTTTPRSCRGYRMSRRCRRRAARSSTEHWSGPPRRQRD